MFEGAGSTLAIAGGHHLVLLASDGASVGHDSGAEYGDGLSADGFALISGHCCEC